MNKHEKMSIVIYFIDDNITPVKKKEMQIYINEAELTEKAYEHLKREIISISRIREPLNREIEFDNLIEKLRGVEK